MKSYTHSLLDFPADPCYNIENRARAQNFKKGEPAMNATAMTKLYSYYELSLSLCPESEETLFVLHTDNSGDDTFIRDALS